MSDNTKNGIIDLTEIVEMGTPPNPASEKNIPASPAGTVDFESELEDLFSSTDFSEFTDSSDASPQPAGASVDDFLTDTPTSGPAVEDFLTDITPDTELAASEKNTTAKTDPSFEPDLDDLLDSEDSKDSSVSFDADFEDLLSEFSDSSSQTKETVHQPDFDEDLSAMSFSSADPEPVAAAQAPQPQAVAPEPAHATESNIADVDNADIDDLFSDLDFELGEVPSQSAPIEISPTQSVPQANASIEDDLLADLDYDLPPMEPTQITTSSADPDPQNSEDDDLFADLNLEFDLDELDATTESTLASQSKEVPDTVPTTTSVIADGSDTDVDDLFTDFDFEIEDVPSTPSHEPVPAPDMSASLSLAEEVSLDDPFDVENILNESSEETPQTASTPSNDFDFTDLDELLRVDNEPAQAPRTDLTAADGNTLDSEEVDMDDIGFLLSELDEASGAQPNVEPASAPETTPEPAIDPELAFEPDAPMEPVVSEKIESADPVDGSMFDEEIDALLDDLEMASAEPVAPISQEPQAPVVNTEPEPTQPVEAPVTEALLEDVSPQVELADAPQVPENDLATELDAMLDSEPVDLAAAEEAQPDVEDIAHQAQVEQDAASTSTPSDELESLLDELDSLLDETDMAAQQTELASDEPEFDFDPDEPVTELNPVVESVSGAEDDMLEEPTSLEEDLGSTLDRILGEDPLSSDMMGDGVEEKVEPTIEPATFNHEDIDALLSDPEPVEQAAMEEPSEMTVESEISSDPAEEDQETETVVNDPADTFAEFAQTEEPQTPSNELNPVSEAMDAIENEAPIADIAQEAMADLESFAEVQPEYVEASEELPEHAEVYVDPDLDMTDINENAAPVPPNASIEDLMRKAQDSSDASSEMLDTSPAVNPAMQNNEPLDVPPIPAMTPEEFAELTERIYYLESTLQNIVTQQEALADQQPPVVEKKVLIEAIDDAFNMDGPLMARVLSAVEVRTESMIESMSTRIERNIKSAIEQTAAKSAAQVIREELEALLTDGLT
ncbi:hypothetical protein [Halodesulfovibrio aestuarii]|uniref:hypothetical protein n=1 Tax=Halodesulfovibrio aestuarii TaxID=126333 RepID=UPI003D341583